ncbi:MAG: sugar ABC transporter ATP-binding protein [Bauldia sp.]|nr:sugar ABC transporter ATP-binding protein [Bauldia sp.]
MNGENTILRMRGIAKRYGAVTALQGVDFTLRRGEVMALLGENGAGKSTLVKTLAGLERPDSGTIEIDGQEVRLRTPHQSLHAGVAYVTQELSIISALSVAENICLGGDTNPIWTTKQLAERVKPFLALVGLEDIDPSTPAGSLSVAQRQLVEIARLLSRNARILILDEPTAALSDTEIEKVKSVVRTLAAEGKAIIYVTHRLGEVFEIANRVTIFRNGNSFDPVEVKDLDIDELIEHLLGRRLEQMFPERGASRIGDTVLDIKDIMAPGLSEPVSLNLRAGEIIGLAGQLGSGANAIVRAIAGVVPREEGDIVLRGKSIDPRDMRDAISMSIAYCSDDRKRDGIFGVRKLFENLSAPSIEKITVGGLLSSRRERELTGRLAEFFEINLTRLGSLAGNLSGGNQQKVALGKWLGIEPSILLVEEPTRGVDVGARAEIYRHLRTLANEGLAIIFVSSDNQEVLGLADTVATFFRGRLVRVAPATDVTPEALFRDVTHPETAEEAEAVS